MRLFTQEASVIEAGVVFIRVNFLFITANVMDNVLMGTLRGYGDSRGPMIMMIATHVFFRQLYLFVVTRYIMNTPAAVGFAYPAGWLSCFVLLLAYYFHQRARGFLIDRVGLGPLVEGGFRRCGRVPCSGMVPTGPQSTGSGP